MAGRCFSLLVLSLTCVLWGAWLKHAATALEGKKTIFSYLTGLKKEFVEVNCSV